jgi:TonB family protein
LSAIGFLFIFIFLAEPAFAQVQMDSFGGKKRGKVTTKYPNGMKASQGKVKNYKKEGEWKYWSDEGALTKVEHYKNDIREGLSTSYYASGKKSEEGSYLDGKKDGAWLMWYSDGSYSSKLNFDGHSNGKDFFYDGVQQWYFENGQLREEAGYANRQLVYRKTFYHSGKKKTIENYKDGKENGTWRTYSEDSKDTLPLSVDNYANGKKEGLHLAYVNGRLSEEWNFKNNLLDGTSKTWDKSGNLTISANFDNGKREGLWRYFDYGKCIREINYHNDKPEGEEKEYDSQARLFRQSWYKAGKPDSVFTYHKNGKRATARAYSYYPGFVHTEEFSDYTEWDTTGVLLLHGTYHFEQKDKQWTTYYPNGKVKSITPYSNGQMSGVYTKFYSSGKKMVEMKVEGHYATDVAKVWYENGKPVKPDTKYYEEIVDSSKPGEIYNDPKQLQHDRIHSPPPTENGVEDVIDIEPTLDKQVEIQQEEVFSFAEQMPEFPGGSMKMQEFLSRNIQYPAVCRDKNQQGMVYVQFTVEKDGSLSDIKVVKSISACPLFDKEAVRVVSSMPKWSPATMNGHVVRCMETIPVRFQLN